MNTEMKMRNGSAAYGSVGDGPAAREPTEPTVYGRAMHRSASRVPVVRRPSEYARGSGRVKAASSESFVPLPVAPSAPAGPRVVVRSPGGVRLRDGKGLGVGTYAEAPRMSASSGGTAGCEDLRNVVVMECMSGGAGLSTLCAMLAADLHGRGMSCALVDADFAKGGMDVLLGLENDAGLRFGTLQIPLGRVSGSALLRQLPQWDGISVLAFDPWNSESPEWWDVQAVVQALSKSLDVVVVDAALGSVLRDVPELARGQRVVAAEMSVVGMVRARMLMNAESTGGEGGAAPVAVVGLDPHSAARRRGVIGVEEACLYLGREVIGPVRPDTALASDLLEGLGIREVPKGARRTVGRLADCVCKQLEEGDRH